MVDGDENVDVGPNVSPNKLYLAASGPASKLLEETLFDVAVQMGILKSWLNCSTLV